MDKMIVAVFDDEKQAYEASRAVKELQQEGSFTLYGVAIVARGQDGTIATKDAGDEGPLGPAVGILAGSLVGILGGRDGVAIGAATGRMIGVIRDLWVAVVDAEVLKELSAMLQPGRVAVVGEAEEHSTTPLDTRIEALGGGVLRRARADLVDRQIQREIQATKDDPAELRAAVKEAREDVARRIESRIDRDKAKLESLATRAGTAADRLRARSEAKVQALEEQVRSASADRKAKFEARIAALRTDSDQRASQLAEAGRLARQAISA